MIKFHNKLYWARDVEQLINVTRRISKLYINFNDNFDRVTSLISLRIATALSTTYNIRALCTSFSRIFT